MKLGLFSVSYAGLWGQAVLTVPDFIRKAGELGFDSVLIMAKRPHLSPLDADKKTLAEISWALRDSGIELIGLACYNDILLAAPPEVPVKEMQLAFLESAARITAELGGKFIRIFTGYLSGSRSCWEGWQSTVDFIGEIGRRAEQYHVNVVVQNHHDLAVESRAMDRLLDEVGLPNVFAGYDAWSPFLRGENLEEGARLMAPRTALTIAANYIRQTRYTYNADLVNYNREYPDFVRATSMEEGEIDYVSFFRGLLNGGFQGPFVYEMCSPVTGGPSIENLDKKARSFLAYMKKNL